MVGMQSVAEALVRLGELAESPTVSTLAKAFEAAGHELALVGGPVRDAFLGRPVHDLDFTTDASPDRILEIVEPIAGAHWDIGRAFGTIGARVEGETVEFDHAAQGEVVAFGVERALGADGVVGELYRVARFGVEVSGGPFVEQQLVTGQRWRGLAVGEFQFGGGSVDRGDRRVGNRAPAGFDRPRGRQTPRRASSRRSRRNRARTAR